MVIPSWYIKYEGDPTGSFFREQSIALAKVVERVGVLIIEQKPIYTVFREKSILSKVSFYKDENLFAAKISTYNYTPRIEQGIAFQWKINGFKIFKKYVSKYGKPDIIQAHCSLYAGYLAKLISIEFGIPYIVTEHSSLFLQSSMNVFMKKIANDVFIKSEKNIAVSSSLKRNIGEKFGEHIPFDVVFNIVKNDFFETEIKEIKDREKIKLINIGLLVEVKNQSLLIDAIAKLKSLGVNNIELDIIGDGPLRNSLEQKVNSLDVGDNVKFLGKKSRDEIAYALLDYDIFVLTSFHETFGVVVAEALSTGLSCIVTPCGGPTDFIDEHDGMILTSFEVDELAAAIKSLSEDKLSHTLSEKLSRRARAKLKFSETVVGNKVVSIIPKKTKVNF